MVALQLPGSAVLLLFRRGGSVNPSPTPGGLIPAHNSEGRQHICMAVPAASLQEWGPPPDDVRHRRRKPRPSRPMAARACIFRDPDGHSLEVATPGLWAHY